MGVGNAVEKLSQGRQNRQWSQRVGVGGPDKTGVWCGGDGATPMWAQGGGRARREGRGHISCGKSPRAEWGHEGQLGRRVGQGRGLRRARKLVADGVVQSGLRPWASRGQGGRVRSGGSGLRQRVALGQRGGQRARAQQTAKGSRVQWREGLQSARLASDFSLNDSQGQPGGWGRGCGEGLRSRESIWTEAWEGISVWPTQRGDAAVVLPSTRP